MILKHLLWGAILLIWTTTCQTQNPGKDSLRYLALGDSYTIGTSVGISERFPMQLGAALQKKGVKIQKPKIIARVGWSTDQLIAAMDRENLESHSWDLLTLLIGVNNQYRGGSLEQYHLDFELLLKRAITLSARDKAGVIVLSIPDYGVTPFGQRYATGQISREIDAYNAVNRKIATQYGVAYCDITPLSRQAAKDKSLIAEDHLHPSGKMYAQWVELLVEIIKW